MSRDQAAEPRRTSDVLSYLVLAGCVPAGAAVAYAVAGPLVAGSLGGLLLVAFLLTAVARLSDSATTWDRATGLPDREAALLRLETLIARRSSLRGEPAVIVVRVEPVGGFAPPDATLLLRAAPRLAEGLRKGDQVARVDERSLAAILSPTRGLDRTALAGIMARISSAFAEWDQEGTVSVGASLLAHSPAPTPSDWLAAAEAAAGQSSITGAPEIFDADGRTPASVGGLLTEIEEAMDRGQIVAFLQPQIDARNGRILAFEALARWQHPVHGLLDPAQWLPAISNRELDRKLLLHMLDEVGRISAHWSEHGYRAPGFGVNASTMALADPEVVGEVAWLLDRYDLGPGRIHIELTEGGASEDAQPGTAQTLAGLTRLGCRIELDDFGPGDARFAEMLRTGARRIKIDGSMVTPDLKVTEGRGEMREIVNMAHTLGAEVVVKRVETPEEHEAALELGFDGIQGFHFAEPMPADEALRWALDRDERSSGDRAEDPRSAAPASRSA